MCSLCHSLSESSSWTDAARDDAVGQTRYHAGCLPFARALLRSRGLVVTGWAGHYVVGNGRGSSLVANDLAACWAAAERLAGSSVDPLEPEAIRLMRAARS